MRVVGRAAAGYPFARSTGAGEAVRIFTGAPGRPGAGPGRAVHWTCRGIPVAMMVTFLRVARPMVLRLAGCRDEAPLFYPVRAGFEHKKKAGMGVRAARGRRRRRPVARKFPRDGAGILSSLVESDGLIELPEELTRVEQGASVAFLPFQEVLWDRRRSFGNVSAVQRRAAFAASPGSVAASLSVRASEGRTG
jgi:molybdopterin biosynthesis enzyme